MIVPREKQVAYRLVRTALEKGTLKRPSVCSRCLNDPGPTKNGKTKIHGHHHKGYDHPLDVEWLCVQCHRDETPTTCGEKNNTTVLTVEDVLFIRQSRESYSALSRRFGVGASTIHRTKAGLSWKHIPMQPRIVTPIEGEGA